MISFPDTTPRILPVKVDSCSTPRILPRYKLVSQLLFDEKNKIKSIEVRPMELDVKADSLANVGGCLNALNFKTDMLGPDLTMIGPGAGKIETGYSLFSDLLYLCGAGEGEA